MKIEEREHGGFEREMLHLTDIDDLARLHNGNWDQAGFWTGPTTTASLDELMKSIYRSPLDDMADGMRYSVASPYGIATDEQWDQARPVTVNFQGDPEVVRVLKP